jgi:hypothetical protein
LFKLFSYPKENCPKAIAVILMKHWSYVIFAVYLSAIEGYFYSLLFIFNYLISQTVHFSYWFCNFTLTIMGDRSSYSTCFPHTNYCCFLVFFLISFCFFRVKCKENFDDLMSQNFNDSSFGILSFWDNLSVEYNSCCQATTDVFACL